MLHLTTSNRILPCSAVMADRCCDDIKHAMRHRADCLNTYCKNMHFSLKWYVCNCLYSIPTLTGEHLHLRITHKRHVSEYMFLHSSIVKRGFHRGFLFCTPGFYFAKRTPLLLYGNHFICQPFFNNLWEPMISHNSRCSTQRRGYLQVCDIVFLSICTKPSLFGSAIYWLFSELSESVRKR